ncbi:MAG: hypothetical protein HW387_800 [Parachlamydiales bacterium]|nr:hypothetical protein [Parachlamydiales bacterium]
MDLSTFHMGPGASISQFESGILEDLIQIMLDANKNQQLTMQEQCDSANSMGDAIKSSFNEQAASAEADAIGAVGAGCSGLAVMTATIGTTWNIPSKISNLEEMTTNLEDLKIAITPPPTPTTTLIAAEPAALPPDKISSQFLTDTRIHVKLESDDIGAYAPFKCKPGDFTTDYLPTLKANCVGKEVEKMKQIDDMIGKLKTDKATLQHYEESVRSKGQSFSTALNSLGQAYGQYFSSDHLKNQGQEKYLEAMMKMVNDFTQQAQTTASKDYDNNKQQFSSVLQLMDAQVYANSGYRG